MANDVATLDQLFLDLPQTIRYGVGGNLYGFDAIAAFREQRAGGSPQRAIRRSVVTTCGRDFATTHLEFQRHGGSRIGGQSQCWIRTRAGWKIASAHVSLMADTPDTGQNAP